MQPATPNTSTLYELAYRVLLPEGPRAERTAAIDVTEHEGRSEYIGADRAGEWTAGAVGLVHFDPEHPAHVMWMAEAPECS